MCRDGDTVLALNSVFCLGLVGSGWYIFWGSRYLANILRRLKIRACAVVYSYGMRLSIAFLEFWCDLS